MSVCSSIWQHSEPPAQVGLHKKSSSSRPTPRNSHIQFGNANHCGRSIEEMTWDNHYNRWAEPGQYCSRVLDWLASASFRGPCFALQSYLQQSNYWTIIVALSLPQCTIRITLHYTWILTRFVCLETHENLGQTWYDQWGGRIDKPLYQEPSHMVLWAMFGDQFYLAESGYNKDINLSNYVWIWNTIIPLAKLHSKMFTLK